MQLSQDKLESKFLKGSKNEYAAQYDATRRQSLVYHSREQCERYLKRGHRV